MSQEELEKLLLEAHVYQDFDLKILESKWFHTFCKVSVPVFTVPSKAKLEQIVIENFEKTKGSATTKLSGIESLSVIVDEWRYEDINQEEFIFQILTCTAVTKLYEKFVCFLGCKLHSKFYDCDIMEKCEEHIPEFQSKLVRVLSSGKIDKARLYHGSFFVMEEVGPKWLLEESSWTDLYDNLRTIHSKHYDMILVDPRENAIIRPYRRPCIALELLNLLNEVLQFLMDLEFFRDICEKEKKEISSWSEFENHMNKRYKCIKQECVTELSRLEFTSVQDLLHNNRNLQNAIQSVIYSLEDQFSSEIGSNRDDHSSNENVPLFCWYLLKAKEILNSDPNSKSFQQLEGVDQQNIPIFNEFFTIVAALQETIDEFLEESEMIGRVIPSYLLLRNKLTEMGKDSDQFPHWKDLAGIINSRLKCRLGYVLEDTEYLLGAVLDPRFKLDWVSSAGKVKSDVETEVREELKKRLATNGTDQGTCDNELPTSEPPAKAPKCSRFSSILSSRMSSTKGFDVDVEFSIYISEQVADDESLKPLSYWKEHADRFPCLSSISRSLFAIPVSLGRPLKVLQIFKDFFRLLKEGYEKEMSEKLVFLKHNAHLLN